MMIISDAMAATLSARDAALDDSYPSYRPGCQSVRPPPGPGAGWIFKTKKCLFRKAKKEVFLNKTTDPPPRSRVRKPR